MQGFAFTLDGAEHVYVDASLGDLPNFVRKIRTKAFWEGPILHTELTSFAEQRSPETGEISAPAGMVGHAPEAKRLPIPSDVWSV